MILNENKTISMVFDSKEEFNNSKEAYKKTGYKITEEIQYFSAIYKKIVYKFSAEYALEIY